MINGVIFQKKIDRRYQGIDGDNWYLNDLINEEWLNEFEDKVEKSWDNDDWVDVCADSIIINNYIKWSKRKHIDYRIILCETEKNEPSYNAKYFKNIVSIGYDYAYSGGSYYSAIYNELYFNKKNCFNQIKLNKYGLIEDYDGMMKFIELRNKLIESGMNLELGDFIVYKLYEANF